LKAKKWVQVVVTFKQRAEGFWRPLLGSLSTPSHE